MTSIRLDLFSLWMMTDQHTRIYNCCIVVHESMRLDYKAFVCVVLAVPAATECDGRAAKESPRALGEPQEAG